MILAFKLLITSQFIGAVPLASTTRLYR